MGKGLNIGFLTALVLVLVTTSLLVEYKLSNQVSVNTPSPTSIVLSDAVMEEINQLYNSNEVEKAFCMRGSITGDIAIVDTLTSPNTQSFTNPETGLEGVMVGTCAKTGFSGVLERLNIFSNDEGFIGIVHNHPNGVCRLSEADIYAFGNSHLRVLGVVCGIDQVGMWTPQDLTNSITWFVESDTAGGADDSVSPTI